MYKNYIVLEKSEVNMFQRFRKNKLQKTEYLPFFKPVSQTNLEKIPEKRAVTAFESKRENIATNCMMPPQIMKIKTAYNEQFQGNFNNFFVEKKKSSFTRNNNMNNIENLPDFNTNTGLNLMQRPNTTACDSKPRRKFTIKDLVE